MTVHKCGVKKKRHNGCIKCNCLKSLKIVTCTMIKGDNNLGGHNIDREIEN